MKKLLSIFSVVLVIATLLCSCDPNYAMGKTKTVNSISLSFPSSNTKAVDGEATSVAFDAAQWKVDAFDWYYKTSATDECTNLGTAVETWTLITKSSDTYTIGGTFFVGDSWDFTVIGIEHSESPDPTLNSDPIALFTADSVTLVVSSTVANNVVTPGFEPTTALTSGNSSKIVLELDYTPSLGLVSSLKNNTATVLINGVTATFVTDSGSDAFANDNTAKLVGKFEVTLTSGCLNGVPVTVTIKKGDSVIVNAKQLKDKVYTYNTITTNIKATLIGDDLSVTGVSFAPKLPSDPNTNPLFGFEAVKENAIVYLGKNSAINDQHPYKDYSLEYSRDGKEWHDYIMATTTGSSDAKITLEKIGDKVYFRAKNDYTDIVDGDEWRYIYTDGTIDDSINAFGNVMYLLDPTGSCTEVGTRAFYRIFAKTNSNVACLHDVSELLLPATTVGQMSYASMFTDQKYITQGPVILAETVTGLNPFGWMFQGCIALEEAPKMHIKSIPESTAIMSYMYSKCEKLARIDLTDCNIVLGSTQTPNWLHGEPIAQQKPAGTLATNPTIYCKATTYTAPAGDGKVTSGDYNTVYNGWTVVNP